MRQLVAGNWKMHKLRGPAAALARAIAADSPVLGCDLLICPPFTALAAVAAVLRGSRVALGAQDCHAAESGAFTGDIAAPMLADIGCSAVIVGHSERRQYYGETSAQVRAKAVAAAAAALMAVVCVGESEAERDAGRAAEVVRAQVMESVPDGFEGVVAYEPVWAIGTGRTPTLDDVAAMHAAIRQALRHRLGLDGAGLRILYGGSVKAQNAAALLAVPEVGGALVGGASLDSGEFLRIAAVARRG
ncbi:MAG: triose-phosphate isomerase [Rhodospirillales bacterium]